MCAILDADVVGEVFRRGRQGAGNEFYQWITTGKGHLVAGGKLLAELKKGLASFKEWERQLTLSGKLSVVAANRVDGRAEELRREKRCVSGDAHIIALAQVSGARLLYSNDSNLHRDFKDKTLIDGPRGKIYSTQKSKEFTKRHRQLLDREDLCQSSH